MLCYFLHMNHGLKTIVLATVLLAWPSTTSAATQSGQPSATAKVTHVALAPKPAVKKPVVKKPVKKAVAAVAVKKAPAKKPVVKKKVVAKKVVACARCRSLAEGADKSAASRANEWIGTVIGLNEGSRSVIITETTKLNHIKAYAQRNVEIDADTRIVTRDGEEKLFEQMDIGYRIEVKGKYDAKKRTIDAASIEIIEVPAAPITKTK